MSKHNYRKEIQNHERLATIPRLIDARHRRLRCRRHECISLDVHIPYAMQLFNIILKQKVGKKKEEKKIKKNEKTKIKKNKIVG